jgi:hypothetical protein
MKVTEFTATDNNVVIAIEPEHPAETALFKLLAGCDAKFETGVENPKDGALITATVKKNSSRY